MTITKEEHDYQHGGWKDKYIITKKKECYYCDGLGAIINRLTKDYTGPCTFCNGLGYAEEPIDPKAVYFVLRLDKDPHARDAAIAYADSVCAENEELADDIYAHVKQVTPEEEWQEKFGTPLILMK